MYSFIIKTFCFENNKYKIRFDKSQEDQFLETVINKVQIWDFEDFAFDLLLNTNILKSFKLKLSKDFINQIVIELSQTKSNNNNAFQIELRTYDYNKEKKMNLIIQKGKEEIKLNLVHNDLNIGKIIILNSDLNFNLFLRDFINKEIKLEETDKYEEEANILEKLKDETNQKKVKSKEEKSNDVINLIGKKVKRLNKSKEIEKTKEIRFKIDSNKIKGDEIIFCLHKLEKRNIMTIHNLFEEEIKDYLNIEYSTSENLMELEKCIINKINIIKNNVKNSKNLIKIDYTIIESNYNNNIVLYKLQNLEFGENHFLAFVNYCYKYISCFIKDVIGKIFKNYESSFIQYEQFGKEIILDLLSKFDYFNEYYKKIIGRENKVENLIIHKKNLSFKEKAEVLSSILTIILNSPKFSTSMNIEFFNIESNGNQNVYFDAKQFTLQIIKKLEGESILNRGYLKTFSRIKEDINEANKRYYNFSDNKVFIIEIINLNELKKYLEDYLPTIIVRYLNSKSKIAAQYDIFSENIIINEMIFIKRTNDFLNNDDNKIFNNLDKIIKGNINFNNEENKMKYNLCIFRTLWKLNHEAFGHKPVSKINKGRANTPDKTIINESYKITKDAGEIIESYVYESSDINNFDMIKFAIFNPKELLIVNLYIQKSFDQFWEVFSNIIKDVDFGDEDEEELKGETQFFYNIAGLFTDNISKGDKLLTNFHFNYKKKNKLIFERFKI